MVSILLIDDDEDFREAVELGLEQAGYEVTSRSCGECGVKAFRRQRQDLVITDVVMDNGEGVETIRQLHELVPELPVIAISAHAPYLQAMKMLGAANVLSKPFRMAELVKVLRSASPRQ